MFSLIFHYLMKIEPSKAILPNIRSLFEITCLLAVPTRENQSDVPSGYTVTASKILSTTQNIMSWKNDKHICCS